MSSHWCHIKAWFEQVWQFPWRFFILHNTKESMRLKCWEWRVQICKISKNCSSRKTGTCGKLHPEPTGEPCDLHPETGPRHSVYNDATTGKSNRKLSYYSNGRNWNKHTSCYLDCQESDVSKLLVEASDLIFMNPGLVPGGHLATAFKV